MFEFTGGRPVYRWYLIPVFTLLFVSHFCQFVLLLLNRSDNPFVITSDFVIIKKDFSRLHRVEVDYQRYTLSFRVVTVSKVKRKGGFFYP